MISERESVFELQVHGFIYNVSASAAGIGLAIASVLAAERARVIINGRTPARPLRLAPIVAAISSAVGVDGW